MPTSVSPITECVHVTSTPGVCGGRPCVHGTRIRVQDVFAWHAIEGRSADQIVAAFPQLTLADVYAALAYFWDHEGEIRSQMRDDDALVAQTLERDPSRLPAVRS